MTQFAFFSALLGLLAVAFAISALWKASRPLALALAIGLPLAAAALYHLEGQPSALNAKATAAAAADAAAPKTMDEAIAMLQKKLASDPENAEGVVLLARSYMATEKYDLARDAYAHAVKLMPDDSDLSVEYAESLARTDPDHRFPPEAVKMLENAVAKNPENQRALFFLGTQRMQDQKPAEAVAIWEKLLPLLEPAVASELRKQIDDARLAAGMEPLPPVAAHESAAGSATTSESLLTISIQIDPTLAKSVKPGDVLFVFARSLDGKGPPFAAKRIELGTLPLQIQLGDADSPMPAAKLSSQANVLLMARVSRTGDVKAASGDIEADPLQVAVDGKQPTTLVLNRTVP